MSMPSKIPSHKKNSSNMPKAFIDIIKKPKL